VIFSKKTGSKNKHHHLCYLLSYEWLGGGVAEGSFSFGAIFFLTLVDVLINCFDSSEFFVCLNISRPERTISPGIKELIFYFNMFLCFSYSLSNKPLSF